MRREEDWLLLLPPSASRRRNPLAASIYRLRGISMPMSQYRSSREAVRSGSRGERTRAGEERYRSDTRKSSWNPLLGVGDSRGIRAQLANC